jgi:outer membrane lipoprotein-sorting protein
MPHRASRIVSHSTVATALIFSACAVAQPAKSNLDSVIAQMNAASAKFTSAQADVSQEIFTKVIHDTETQTGKIYFLRRGGSIELGMIMLPPDAPPNTPPAQIVQFKDGKGAMLNTGTGQVDQASATGKNQVSVETALTLGFGGSGSDLEKSWTITDLGAEKLAESAKTVAVEKLDLVPKDSGIRNTYSHVTVWIDPMRDVSLKQIFFIAASGDTRTMIYSNIRLNQTVDVAPFAIKCKGKCTYVNH